MATIKQAFKAARAAFAENYRKDQDYDAAEHAADLALRDRGVSTRKSRGWNILNNAMIAMRPGVERMVNNAEACPEEF